MMPYYQTKLQVIHPDSGNEDFVVVHNIIRSGEPDLKMVRVSDVVRFGIMGYTYDILNKLKRTGKIMFRDQRGDQARPGPAASYVCLHELTGDTQPPATVHLSKRKMRVAHV